MSELQNVPTDQSECGDNTLHGPPIPDPGENDAANHCVQPSDSSASTSCLPSSTFDTQSSEFLKLGSVTWLSDQPGRFVRYEGEKGETIPWPNHPYTDTLIPVLHHGAIGSGVDKCDLCHFDLSNNGCRRGVRCTYAHGWSDRVE